MEENFKYSRQSFAQKEVKIKEEVLKNFCKEQSSDGYQVNKDNLVFIDDDSYFDILYMYMLKSFNAQTEGDKPFYVAHYMKMGKNLNRRHVRICDYDIYKKPRGKQYIINLEDYSVGTEIYGYNQNIKRASSPLPQYIVDGIDLCKENFKAKEK